MELLHAAVQLAVHHSEAFLVAEPALAQRLERLAWTIFVEGDRRITPTSALAAAVRRYDAEHGVWAKTCPGCDEAFIAKRCDATFCSNRCEMRSWRARRLLDVFAELERMIERARNSS